MLNLHSDLNKFILDEMFYQKIVDLIFRVVFLL